MNKQFNLFFLVCIVSCAQGSEKSMQYQEKQQFLMDADMQGSPSIEEHSEALKKQRALAKQPHSMVPGQLPPPFDIFGKYHTAGLNSTHQQNNQTPDVIKKVKAKRVTFVTDEKFSA